MTKTSKISPTIQKAAQLREVIAGTNNGYLFAPDAEQVYIATLFPDKFSISYAPLAEHFKFRISNK